MKPQADDERAVRAMVELRFKNEDTLTDAERVAVIECATRNNWTISKTAALLRCSNRMVMQMLDRHHNGGPS